MSSPKVRTATLEDEAAVHNVVLLAFVTDPFARWAFPDAATYLVASPLLGRAFGGNGFAHGTVDVVEEECGTVGAAMWLPPGVEPDIERMQAILAEHASDEVLGDMGGLIEQMGAAHPAEPCWYLPIIGVDPAFHGRGVGSALLHHATARADAAGLPAYLESSNPRNRSLYERHGFVAMGTIQSGSSPAIVPMLRKPR
jgi:GNAT superfamily N-acetyltransferase